MSGSKIAAAVGAVALLIGVPWYFKMVSDPAPGVGSTSTSTTPPPLPPTTLIIEMSGGFAYVPDDSSGKFEVGYLTDVNLKNTSGQELCKVDEIGAQLIVVRGKIASTSPSTAPNNRTFDLDGINVTIPALTGTNLTYTRNPYPPGPAKPTSKAEWKNLQFVPSIKDFHTGSRIKSKWRDEVSGRLELHGGSIDAMFPTDPTIELADFKFKRGTSLDKDFAVTDKVIYKVDLPAGFVQLELAKSTVGAATNPNPLKYTSVKIEPTISGQPIRLKLHGLHSSDSLASFVQNGEVKDFCAFYSLLDPAPTSKSEMVKMTYNGPTGMYDPNKKPSPGYFCMGDWF